MICGKISIWRGEIEEGQDHSIKEGIKLVEAVED